jgi:hypothetical protein
MYIGIQAIRFHFQLKTIKVDWLYSWRWQESANRPSKYGPLHFVEVPDTEGQRLTWPCHRPGRIPLCPVFPSWSIRVNESSYSLPAFENQRVRQERNPRHAHRCAGAGHGSNRLDNQDFKIITMICIGLRIRLSERSSFSFWRYTCL